MVKIRTLWQHRKKTNSHGMSQEARFLAIGAVNSVEEKHYSDLKVAEILTYTG